MKNLSLNNIGTLKLVVRILTTYLIIIMMIPSLQAVLPFKSTMHKRQNGSCCTAPLGTHMVHSARHCAQWCSVRINCKVFNVIRVQQEAPGFQCEMFSHSDPDHQVDDDNAVLWQLNYCHGHQCKNGGVCSIKEEGYVCACPKGYTGQYCETDLPECKTTEQGKDYNGKLSVTENGRVCQRWDSQVPHTHSATPERYPDANLVDNYCRNPTNVMRPWCLTTDPDVFWEYCDVPDC